MTIRRIVEAIAGVVLLATHAVGCGYRSAHHPEASGGRYCVESGPQPSYPKAASSLLMGAQDALASSSLLADCTEAHRLVLQVQDVSFEPEGVIDPGQLTARGTRVRVTAAGRVGKREIGTVIKEAVVATGANALSEKNAQDVGVTIAAQRAGKSIVFMMLGEPIPTTIE
ncbi:MAG: hypothetical protein CSA75_01235 [Sorangium cellulosum]|nr:MAG: hypothetical protein CSA75_01235 [Sorangium cellulosum]